MVYPIHVYSTNRWPCLDFSQANCNHNPTTPWLPTSCWSDSLCPSSPGAAAAMLQRLALTPPDWKIRFSPGESWELHRMITWSDHVITKLDLVTKHYQDQMTFSMSCDYYMKTWRDHNIEHLRFPPQHTTNGTDFSMGVRQCTHFFITEAQPVMYNAGQG